MKRAISHLATMDCLFSLAEVAKQGDYCRWCPLTIIVNIGACVSAQYFVCVYVCVCVCVCVWYNACVWVSCVVSYSLRQAVCGSVHRAQQRVQPKCQHHTHTHTHTHTPFYCPLIVIASHPSTTLYCSLFLLLLFKSLSSVLPLLS